MKDGSPPTTSTTTSAALLWIFLIMTTITRAATEAIQRPVIKRGSTVCLVEETFNVSPGGQQFITDEHPVQTWDIWLKGKLFCIPAEKGSKIWLEDEEERDKHDNVKRLRVTQRTTGLVQWMVFKCDSGDFDEEAPVGSASHEAQGDRIQCRYWEAWLNGRTAQFWRATCPYKPLTQSSRQQSSHQLLHLPGHPFIHQRNVQTTKFFSFLTPATMMCLSPVAQRTVQQVVVISRAAAESYHKRVQCQQWDVWLGLVELPGVERGPQDV